MNMYGFQSLLCLIRLLAELPYSRVAIEVPLGCFKGDTYSVSVEISQSGPPPNLRYVVQPFDQNIELDVAHKSTLVVSNTKETGNLKRINVSQIINA